MHSHRRLSLALLTAFCLGIQAERAAADLRQELAEAQKRKDLPAITRITAEYTNGLGDKAGLPEQPEKYLEVAAGNDALKSEELVDAYQPYLEHFAKEVALWKSKPQPTVLKSALRAPAGVVCGALSALRAGAKSPEALLQTARDAGEFLLWAQEQGGGGYFPVPDLRGKGGRLDEVISHMAERATREGVLDQVIKNGWVVNDSGNGDLQFDTGLCGVAMVELYLATGEERYLASARRAARWAMDYPCVPNWNYNSFSVYLLARCYAATGEAEYLASAKEKVRLGVLPGQLSSGPRAGHWGDAHNARLGYHWIMLRALAELAAVLPATDPDRVAVIGRLAAGLEAVRADIEARRVSFVEGEAETLSLISLRGLDREPAIARSGYANAFALIETHICRSFHSGKPTVFPNAWGAYLEAKRCTLK
jgi:hypothetical protein